MLGKFHEKAIFWTKSEKKSHFCKTLRLDHIQNDNQNIDGME